MDRIKQLCAFLEKCESFADVACDHGYVAQYMLRNGLCKRAVVSDISDKCLSKARDLLSDFINAGTCRAVCCDGLEKIEKDTDFVFYCRDRRRRNYKDFEKRIYSGKVSFSAYEKCG